MAFESTFYTAPRRCLLSHTAKTIRKTLSRAHTMVDVRGPNASAEWNIWVDDFVTTSKYWLQNERNRQRVQEYLGSRSGLGEYGSSVEKGKAERTPFNHSFDASSA